MKFGWVAHATRQINSLIGVPGVSSKPLAIYTGRPIGDIVSLTVIGPDVLEADRFSTAAFAMGKSGIHFIEDLPGFEGYVVDGAGIATQTSGFKAFVPPRAAA